MVEVRWIEGEETKWLPARVESLPTPFTKLYHTSWYTRGPNGVLEPVWVNKQANEYSSSNVPRADIRLPIS